MNIITKITEAFAKMRASWKESNRQAEREALRKAFYIDEKLGTVYIVHNGVAFMEFSPDENIEMITRMIEDVRNIAIKYNVK